MCIRDRYKTGYCGGNLRCRQSAGTYSEDCRKHAFKWSKNYTDYENEQGSGRAGRDVYKRQVFNICLSI